MYSIPRRGGSEGENGDKEEGGSRSISRPVVRERRPAMLCATERNKWRKSKGRRNDRKILSWLGQTNFDYRYYSYYSLDDGFLLVSLDSASQHLSLLRRTLFYTRLFNHYSANSIISRIKSRNKRTLRSQKEKKEKNRNYRFSSPIFSISRD